MFFWGNFCYLEKKPDFYIHVSSMLPKIYKDVLNFHFVFFFNGQIWLNQHMDGRHLGYITNLWGKRQKKDTDG